MRPFVRFLLGLLLVGVIGFSGYLWIDSGGERLNEAMVQLHKLFPQEAIQLTQYGNKVGATLTAPDSQDSLVNSEFTLEGTIDQIDLLSEPYVWAEIDYLDGASSSFSYYIPIQERKFSQQVKLFAGKGNYRITLRVPSPTDRGKFYTLTSFQVHNLSAKKNRDIEYHLNALKKDLRIDQPASGYDQVNQVFHLSGTISKQANQVLVQTKKGEKEWKRTISARNGRFSESIPLLFGRGTYEVNVMVPGKKKGYFLTGASFYLHNSADKSFQPIRYSRLYHERGVKLITPLTSGDHADLYYKIEGRIDPTAPYAKETSNLIVQTVKGGDKATYFIPVKQYHFKDAIPLRFGPGKYEITLFVPDLKNKNRNFFRFYNVATFDVVSHVDRDYRDLLPSRGIQPNHPRIKKLARKITKGKKTDRQKAKAIFRFVATYMNYDLNKLRNDGFDWDDSALKSLRTRKGVCQDYVFLGLSLLRALEIPSRFVEGEAGNQRHAWIEVRINDKWITMDPTWGSGYITPDGRFVKRYDERYFNPSKQFFRRTHRRTGVVY